MQNTEEKIKNDKELKNHRLFSRILKIIIAIVFVATTLLITFGNGIGIPSWNDIFALCGIYADYDKISFSFINVGSADACYIKCGDSNILIDAGTGLCYDEIFYYLKRNNCTHFDAIILSHPDGDHVGSMADILDDFSADVVYMSKIPKNVPIYSEDYDAFINCAEKYNVPITYPKISSSVKIGDVELEFISPLQEYDSTNDNSLVVKIKYMNVSALFTGDISKDVEKDLLDSKADLDVDILKVAHHGSKTASSESFLKAVTPKISVVSVGSSDIFLPDYKTMAYIDKYSEQLYRTDRDNTVVVTSDGNDLSVHTDG